MFEVGLLQVKTELSHRVESMLFKLLSKFEQDVTQQSIEIDEIFKSVEQKYSEPIKSARDVVELEAFKNTWID